MNYEESNVFWITYQLFFEHTMNYEEMNVFWIIFPIFGSRRPPHRLEEVRLAPQWPAASRRRPVFLNIVNAFHDILLFVDVSGKQVCCCGGIYVKTAWLGIRSSLVNS